MKRIALALILCLANSSHASSVLLETVQHIAVFDAVPTGSLREVHFSAHAALAASFQWQVPYIDSDLGVTTWHATDAQVLELRRVMATPPAHGGTSSVFAIGRFPNTEVINMIGYPVNVTTEFANANSRVLATMNQRTYLNPVVLTALEMELSPFSNMGGRFQATQTLRLYEPIPEPSTIAMTMAALAFALCKKRLA
jgi:hypothetical protein